jgi:predicted HTH transcriptional regulator
LIDDEENETLEKKESLLSHGNDTPDEVITDQVIKACLGFLNQRGGTVLVGVSDSNEVIGVGRDINKKGSADKLVLYLGSKIRDKIGRVAVGLINISTPSTTSGETVLRVDVEPSTRAVFTVADVDKKSGLYVRNNNSTSLLKDQDAHEYIIRHWPEIV